MNQAQYVILLFLLMNFSVFTYSSSVQEGEDVDLQPFIKVGSKYYLVTTPATGRNWFEAVHFCRSYDSDLLTLESLAERKALFSHLRLEFSYMTTWTSSNDLSVEGAYMSLNSGRPMIYANWGPGESNNAGDAEDCIELMAVKFAPNGFYMFDNNCLKRQRHIICEKRSPLNNRNSASKSNCENVAWNCGFKKTSSSISKL